MAGQKETSQKLNNTLLFIARLLNENNFIWFISYGTLLGIIRDNSCIENDDDIDIMILKSSCPHDKLLSLLQTNNFEMEYGYGIKTSKNIIKTKTNERFASIDFYFCDKNDKNDFKDLWNSVTWTNCYDKNQKLISKEWNDTILYIPNNYVNKLEKRYGTNWKVPMKSKGNWNARLL